METKLPQWLVQETAISYWERGWFVTELRCTEMIHNPRPAKSKWYMARK